jgi:hypothetical protein
MEDDFKIQKKRLKEEVDQIDEQFVVYHKETGKLISKHSNFSTAKKHAMNKGDGYTTASIEHYHDKINPNRKMSKEETADLEEMKRSNPFLYAGSAKDRNRHAKKARTKNEEVDFTSDELEHLESIIDSFADGNKVNEAKDEREYGYEGEMVSSQLRSIIQNAEALLGMIQPDTDFPEWVQSKITLAQDYMLSAKDYMSTEMSEETKLDEARGRPKKTGEAPEGDDTHKHPIQQLSKIGYAIQGSEPAFEHKDGSKTKITKQLARHITTAYNAMRTSQEKDDFATKLHANRDSMMAAVKKHV